MEIYLKLHGIASLCKDNLHIYSGNDDQILPVLSLGGLGVISVLANISPQKTHEMIEYYFNGNISSATKMQLEAIPLVHALFSEVNPIPVISALNMMGYDFGIPRLPLVEMSASMKENLNLQMKEYNIL